MPLQATENSFSSTLRSEESLNFSERSVGKYCPLKEIYTCNYEPITLKDVNECIQKYFVKTKMNVFMVGEHVLSETVVKRECSRVV